MNGPYVKNALRQSLQSQSTAYGMWVTLESPNVTEVAVLLGLDFVVVEMEHGHLMWRDVIDHVRVTTGTDTSALIRVADATRENIQRGLDIGAAGLIVPMIGSGAELEQVFQFGSYSPRGVRGVGGERCVSWGMKLQEYVDSANEETLLIPLLETRAAVENIDSILNVEGLQAIFFGPADMSASFGHLGQWEGGPVGGHIRRMRQLAADRGIASGILARNGREAQTRRFQGFGMIALGADVNLMLCAVRGLLEEARA